jgi:spectinomycin phosphotransferase
LNARPPELSDDDIRVALADGWGIEAASIDYSPVGFGSHHWVTPGWFVTVDDLRMKPWLADTTDDVFACLGATYGAAADLASSGCEFVCAPVQSRRGDALHRLTDDFSLAVFPFLEGRHAAVGYYESEPDRDDVLRMLARLHAAPPTPGLLVDDYAVSARDGLDHALDELTTEWTSGPLSEEARRTLADSEEHLRHALAAHDDFARRAAASAPRQVITHGEPHAANVIFTTGGPRLIDWDTVKVAPIERDLARVVGNDADDATAYLDAGGDPPNEDRLLMYSLWWDLNDVALYTEVLRNTHERTADTEKMLRGLGSSIQLGERFPGLLD